MKLRLPSDRIRGILELDPLELPTNVSPLINLANTFAQGTRPSVVGKLTELIQEFGDGDLAGWEKWYLDRNAAKLVVARELIKAKLAEFRQVLDRITDEQIDEWVRDLVLVKTYIGLRVQDAILRDVARAVQKEYREASSVDESRNIDGWIGVTPVSVKPDSYKQKPELRGDMPSALIFYSKGDKGIYTVEFDEKLIV